MSKVIFGQFYGFPIQKAVALMLYLPFVWIFLKGLVVKKANKKILWKLFNLCIACTMVGIILILTVSSRGGVEELVLMPFQSFIEGKTNRDLRRSIFMNVFLFFPLGLTLPFALAEKWKKKVFITIIFAFLLSLIVEFLQYYYQLGRAETDDVICNTLGTAIGTISYTLERKFFDKRKYIDNYF